MKGITFGRWYNEYHKGIRFHDYFTFIISQFPVLAVRKYQNDGHSDSEWTTYSIAIVGFTLNLQTKKQ